MDRRPSARSTKVKPKLTVRCSGCGAPLGNPLTHRCTTKTDFKQQKKQAAKPKPKPASTGNAHEYTGCGDENCPRFPCRVYREGFEDGRRRGFDEGKVEGAIEGFEEGYKRGWQEGYDVGFPAGIAACPLSHQG